MELTKSDALRKQPNWLVVSGYLKCARDCIGMKFAHNQKRRSSVPGQLLRWCTRGDHVHEGRYEPTEAPVVDG